MNIFTLELFFKYEGSSLYTVVDSFDEAIKAKDAMLASDMYFDNVVLSQWTNGETVWSESYYR